MAVSDRGLVSSKRVRRRRAGIATIPVLAVSLLSAPAIAADPERGLDLAKRWCNACHSIGDDEPRQEDAGPLFTELANKDEAYLQTAINKPHDFMPDFPQLTDVDKGDLIAYIRSLGN